MGFAVAGFDRSLDHEDEPGNEHADRKDDWDNQTWDEIKKRVLWEEAMMAGYQGFSEESPAAGGVALAASASLAASRREAFASVMVIT